MDGDSAADANSAAIGQAVLSPDSNTTIAPPPPAARTPPADLGAAAFAESRIQAPGDGVAPAVSGLSAGLVPLREFPLRKWYYADPLWYYHAPALRHTLRSDGAFYELVDPLLRELCKLLFDAGLCTTPSCEGHFYPRERFERIWSNLLRDAESIRSSGLVVTDSETDAVFRFADPAYTLPWASFDAFYAAAGAHQNEGYVGIAVPPQRGEVVARLRNDAFVAGVARIDFDEELSALLGQPLFGVRVSPRHAAERDTAWAAVTAYLRATLVAVGAVSAAGAG